MGVRIVSPPVHEPITLAEAKLHARVDSADEDALFSVLITAARAHGENLTRRSFSTQTLELTLPRFPAAGASLELPRPPFQSLVSFTYLDATGNAVIPATTDYFVLDDSDAVPPRVYPAPGASWWPADTWRAATWPETCSRPDAVVLRYVAGWPVDANGVSSLPGALRSWLLLRVTSLYCRREPFVVGSTGRNTLVELPRDFSDGLLDAFVIPEVV